MAEQSCTPTTAESSYSNGLEKLVEELTCPVCHEFFQEPKILPCLHFYCRQCLEELTTNYQPETPFFCPECRAETVLTKQDVLKLPTAFFVNRLKTVYSTMTKAHGRTEVICELCNSSESPASAFCRHCAQFICAYCEHAHMRLKPYRGHVIISTEELSQNTTKHLPISNTELSKCEEHDQEIKLLCFDCDQLICRDCTVIDHKNHSYDFIKKLAQSVKKSFVDNLAILQEDQKCASAARESITQSKIDVTIEAKTISDFVNQSIDDLILLYEQCRQDLLQQIHTESNEKMTELSTRDKQLALVKTEVQSLVDFVEKTLDNGTDEDVVSIHKQVHSRADQEHKKCVEKCSLAQNGSDKLSIQRGMCVAKIAGIASTCASADPEKCTVEIKPANVGKESQIILHTLTSTSQPCHAKQILKIEIKSVTHSKSCQTTSTKKRPGIYEISYTPFARGRYTVAVLVNDTPIAGSPFHLQVKPTISQMRTPFRTITGVQQLTDITVTTEGRLLATQTHQGRIISLDREGEEISVVASGINCPIGIATNKMGNTYITDGRSHCLRKFDKSFKSIGTVGCQGGTLGNFNNPGRLDINQRGEVFVCDKDNSRIQIFDANLRFRRWYGTGKPLGVACGKKDEIFVTDMSKNRLCIIHDQTFGLREFCKDLNTPRGTFVNEDYVYITEAGSSQISVYRHDGRFVGSLGNGVLKNPGGITGDEDGFLYVCDEGASAIFIF